MSDQFAELLDSAHQQTCPAVVAIPAKNEADRTGVCLTALSDQQHRPDAVILLLNKCTDGTEATARALAPRLGFEPDLACLDLTPAQANAGCARRLAMQLAAERAGRRPCC
jgi:hypothetical protein